MQDGRRVAARVHNTDDFAESDDGHPITEDNGRPNRTGREQAMRRGICTVSEKS